MSLQKCSLCGNLEDADAIRTALLAARAHGVEAGRRMGQGSPPAWDEYEHDTDDVGMLEGFDGVVVMTGPLACGTGLKMSRATARALAERLLGLLASQLTHEERCASQDGQGERCGYREGHNGEHSWDTRIARAFRAHEKRTGGEKNVAEPQEVSSQGEAYEYPDDRRVPAGSRSSDGGPDTESADATRVAGATPAGSFGSRERGESSAGVPLTANPKVDDGGMRDAWDMVRTLVGIMSDGESWRLAEALDRWGPKHGLPASLEREPAAAHPASDFETLKNAVELTAYNFFFHPKDGWSLTPAGVELLISALRPWMADGQVCPTCEARLVSMCPTCLEPRPPHGKDEVK